MGTCAPPKRAARGVRNPLANDEVRMTALKLWFQRSLILCALCVLAGNSFAQTFDALAETINRGNVEQKREALRVIRNLESGSASRVAVPALRDSSEIVRATAAFSVIFLPPDEALRVLSPLLKDKKELVRREAAYALGKTRNPNAAVFLTELYRTDKVAEVKNAAIVAVGEIGDASAINFLTEILRSKPKKENESNDFLRRAAARSIGQIAQILQYEKTKVVTPESFAPRNSVLGDVPNFLDLNERFPAFGAATPILINVLQNRNETNDVRREAAFALGAIGDSAAIPVLQANSASEDYYLAEISRRALIKIEKIIELKNSASNAASSQVKIN